MKMKRILSALLACSMCLSVTACGGSETPSEPEAEIEITTEPTTEEVTEAPTFPSYKTMPLTPSEMVEKMNASGKYTKTWKTGYTATDNGDGTSNFEMEDTISGIEYSGRLENSTQKMITLTGFYLPAEEYRDSTDKNTILLNAMLGVALLSDPIVYIFGKTSEEATSMLTTASGSESLSYRTDGYIFITLGFAANMPILMIWPEAESTTDGIIGDNNGDNVIDEKDWEIEYKDYLNNKLKDY